MDKRCKENIDILFFERPLVDLRKFAFKIAAYIKKINQELKLGAVCIELPDKSEKTNIDYVYQRDAIKNIDEFIRNHGVKEIVFTNYRIPDLEFILHAKKMGIKTIMLQEGVMFDGMNINDVTMSNIVTTVVSYFGKAVSYLNIVREMCRYDGKRFFPLILNLLKQRKNITHIIGKSFSIHLICDYVLTMGSYWEEYYTEQLGYPKENIRLIGDHDLDDFTVSPEKEPAICYIANVLVEDGTVRKKEFLQFLDTFAHNVDRKTKLYIKLHPRSDHELYAVFKEHNVEFLRETGALPSTTVYVGHRSALLGRALYESDNLIIWRFSNEEVCFYERFATAVCTTETELANALRSVDIHTSENKKKAEIESVFWKNPKGAISSAAEIIWYYYMDWEV